MNEWSLWDWFGPILLLVAAVVIWLVEGHPGV